MADSEEKDLYMFEPMHGDCYSSDSDSDSSADELDSSITLLFTSSHGLCVCGWRGMPYAGYRAAYLWPGWMAIQLNRLKYVTDSQYALEIKAIWRLPYILKIEI